MIRTDSRAILSAVGLSVILAACSAGGSDSSSSSSASSFFVQFCSLTCSNGQTGGQVACIRTDTFLNEELAVDFSDPVSAASIQIPDGALTFQVIERPSGVSVPGTRSVDPNNPRRVIFRPLLEFTNGVASFGFKDPSNPSNNVSGYDIFIPGQAQGDPGPYIVSTSGRPNQTRVDCSILPNQGVTDLVPGDPTVNILVDVIDDMTGGVIPGVPADGATNVDLNTQILFCFNDVMNPATLASNGAATLITVKIDNDGNLADPTDQITVEGVFEVDIDIDNRETKMLFVPTEPLPSSGEMLQRKIVLNIPAEVQDLAGNSIANPGFQIMTTESLSFDPVEIVEDFSSTANLDQSGSGANWGIDVGLGGRVTRGIGGGSGRLGSLVVRAGQTLVLNTDNQTFPLPEQARSILDNTVPDVDYTANQPATWPTITVTDGIFEFENLVVQSGATLVFEGFTYARVYVRGEAVINGTVDISGGTPNTHNSSEAYSLPGGVGGPAAGNGGAGATRFDHGNDALTTIANPGPPALGTGDFPLGPADPVGQDGEGVGKTIDLGLGLGGVRYPDVFPSVLSTGNPNIGGTEWVGVNNACRSVQVGGAGSGGAYVTSGGPGIAVAEVPISLQGNPNSPGQTPGSTGGIDAGWLTPAVRTLDPLAGQPPFGVLRGGGGGGGGGIGLFGTDNSGSIGSGCVGPLSFVRSYFDHSAASGGGGGGALQLTCGHRLELNGVIDATGGDGGSSLTPGATAVNCTVNNCGQFAAPGGAGSGGAVRLQSRLLNFSGTPGRILVDGGQGGAGVTGSTGGDGGHGIVRMEDNPDDPGDAIELATGLPVISPDQSADPGTSEVLSTTLWGGDRDRPGSFSGAFSCWIKPAGNFFELVFDDDTDPLDPAQQGWNMTVLFDAGAGLQPWPYRGIPNDPDFPLPGMSFQEVIGNTINSDQPVGVGSYMAIRFQGARLAQENANLCDLELTGLDSGIALGSLTPWVQHPADLNLFSPRPNMVRYALVFDLSMLVSDPFNINIKGFTDLRISADPD